VAFLLRLSGHCNCCLGQKEIRQPQNVADYMAGYKHVAAVAVAVAAAAAVAAATCDVAAVLWSPFTRLPPNK